jgi:hypothetical protein
MTSRFSVLEVGSTGIEVSIDAKECRKVAE